MSALETLSPLDTRTEKQVYAWIRVLAQRLSHKYKLFTNPLFELEELIAEGYKGYLGSIQKYHPDKGVSFKSYSEHRVIGQIQDFIRGNTPGKRWLLSGKKNPNPRPYCCSLDSLLSDGPEAGEDYHVLLHEFSHLPDYFKEENLVKINFYVMSLSERERDIIKMYFWDDLSMKEIAEKVGLTESRISQIVGRAIIKLRRKMQRMGVKVPLKDQLVDKGEVIRMGRGRTVPIQELEKMRDVILSLEEGEGIPTVALRLGLSEDSIRNRCDRYDLVGLAAKEKGIYVPKQLVSSRAVPSASKKEEGEENSAEGSTHPSHGHFHKRVEDPNMLNTGFPLFTDDQKKKIEDLRDQMEMERISSLPDFGFHGVITFFKTPFRVDIDIKKAILG